LRFVFLEPPVEAAHEFAARFGVSFTQGVIAIEQIAHADAQGETLRQFGPGVPVGQVSDLPSVNI
jgi:hypothetical protein